MSILDTDVKLMASERLTDNEDGGGQMSAVEVVDGVVNNLFPDISRLDRTYGRVNLRKCYAAVRTANRDIYYGSHAVVTDAPDDPNVSVLMLTTDSYTDERSDAKDKIESYVVEGPESPYVLLGDQLKGQRMLKAYSRVDAQLPEVGQVYLLSVEGSGGSTGEQQYVRIDTVTHELQEFEDSKGVFTRRVYTLEIGSALRETFPGVSSALRVSDHNSSTLLRSTQVADASKYYGIIPLDENISQGDLTVKASTIFGQLVPSSTVESPVVDVQAGSDRLNLVAAGPAYTINAGRADKSSFSFGRAVTPKTLSFSIHASGFDRSTFEDDGDGNIYCVESSSPTYGVPSIQYGTVDYESGLIQDTKNGGSTDDFIVKATPAAAVYDVSHTDNELIELANRGYNYTKTLRPIPQAGTLFIDYMAQGNWYRMQDDGSGKLVDEYGGTGTVDYVTGSVIATLGALPDSGSSLIYTWASPAHYEIKTDDPDIEPPFIEVTVTTEDILPGSLSVSWDAGGSTYTATDDGNGEFTGDGEGRIIYGLGKFGLKPDVVPDSDALLSISYDSGSPEIESFSAPTLVGNNATFTVANAPIEPKTFAASFTQDWSYTKNVSANNVKDEETGTSSATVTDDGAGNLSNGGTINYATGEVSMPVQSTSSDVYSYIGRKLVGSPTTVYETTERSSSLSSPIQVKYQQDSITGTAESESVEIPNTTFNLTPTTVRQIQPGSIEFTWNGKDHYDYEGVIYSDWNRQTGAASAVGVIDYASGQISLTDYVGGGNGSVTIKSLLVKYGSWFSGWITFRTPGAPLRPGSFQLRATLPSGTPITIPVDNQGVIDTNDAQGAVNFETGVVDINFGKYVVEADLTADQRLLYWYDADDITEDGDIWYPAPVDPTTMKFNAVIYSIMPLDSDILGLDPVRLPIDGRVPIIRSGDIIVIHSTKQDELPGSLTASQNVSLSRDKLASCYLIDQDGTAVDSALYSVDREAGVVEMASPLDLSAYTEPLVAAHRIEDMALVNEAQINGYLALVGAVSRDYDAADTFISSALIFGDIGSRVHHLFSQGSWTGAWSDDRIGSNTTAQYNDLLYPIQVDNKNSIRERWAIIFTSSLTFNVVGEVSGQIATGGTGTDCTPTNPVTGEPYFTILSSGWGGGWSSGNVLRFNTDAAHSPIWIARTTISGTPTKEDDSFKLQIRGDSD
jgi:hypothetical protein